MRIVSANLNHRLGSASVNSRIEEWLASHSPDLFVSQEAFTRSLSAPPGLAGFTLLATNVLTSCWVADYHVPPTVVSVSDRWQKIVLDGLVVHNVYFSPYSARERVKLLHGIAEDLASTTDPVVVVGDFNMAPRPEDGIFGSRPSTFTTAREREALAYLLTSARLIDATRPGNRVKTQFTFERITKGQPSKFRCDLALVSERLGQLSPFPTTILYVRGIGHSRTTAP